MVDLVVSWAEDPLNNIVNVEGKGFGAASITRNAAGDWAVLLPGTGPLDVVNVQCTVHANAGDRVMAHIQTIDETLRTVRVGAYDVVAAAAYDLGPLDHFFMRVTIRNSQAD